MRAFHALDDFARLWVLPQTGHGLSGRAAAIDGEGNATSQAAIPASLDRFALLQNWVENGVAPGMSEIVRGAAGSLPGGRRDQNERDTEATTPRRPAGWPRLVAYQLSLLAPTAVRPTTQPLRSLDTPRL